MKNYFLLLIVFLLFSYACIPFPWSRPTGAGDFISNVQSIPSNSSTCPGGIDLIINGVMYPCIGGAGSYPVEGSCPEGLTGIKLNSTLVCGVIGKILPAGNGTDDCEFGGVEFISNTVNTTLCRDNPLEQQEINNLYNISNYISSQINNINYQLNVTTSFISPGIICMFGGISYSFRLGSNYTVINNCFLPSFTNTPSLTFTSTPTSVSGDVTITTTDITSGYASALAGCSGNNCNFKQFRGDDPSKIDVYNDMTTVIVKSNINSNNLPCLNVSSYLFPDCPLAITQEDINTCLAGRTLPNLQNFTNLQQTLYTPSSSVLGKMNITGADGFDVIFEHSKPSFTRIWEVDVLNGNDNWEGSLYAPFKTIGKAFSLIGTFTWTQTQLVHLAFGTYVEGPLVWPPNTFLSSDTFNLRISIITPNITLRSDWATAGPRVEAGIEKISIITSAINIDFATIMGPRPPTSIAKFSFTNSEIHSPIVGKGAGVTDLFHFFLNDLEGSSVSINCANLHLENNNIESNLLITDNVCGATQLSWHVVKNYMDDAPNTTFSHSTSTTIGVDYISNGGDGGFLAVYSPTVGALIFKTFLLPLYRYIDPTVTVIMDVSLTSTAMADLDPTYWGAPLQNGFQMLNTVAGRAKTPTPSGLGTVQLIYSNTITNNYFNDLSSLTSALALSQSSGVISFNIITANLLFNLNNAFRGQSSISFAYLAGVFFDEVLPSITNIWWVDTVNGDDSYGTGAPNNKFKTIEHTFNVIGTFPATQIQQVMLIPGIYNENNIQWPPNTYVVGFGSREDRVVVTMPNNVELRSDWSSFANDVVEAGIENVEWTCSKFVLDFIGVMGGVGPSSNVKFNFYNAFIDAVYIITGRGETDHISWRETVVLLNIDPDCVSIYSRDSDFNGKVAITDNNCAGTNLVMELLYNKFGDSFSATRGGAATFAVQSMLNTYTLGAGTSFNGAITLTANGLPPDVVIDPSTTLTNLLGANSVVMHGLPTPYYTSTELPMTDIINTITPRAKSLVHSGVGSSPIFSTSTTTNTLNGFSGTTNQFTFTVGGGALTGSIPSDFRPPGVIYLASTTGITASGATQGTATALSATTLEHFVTTVAASTGVRLPTPAVAGAKYTIYNRGVNALNVYPAIGGAIDAGTVNAPVVIPVGTVIQVSSASGTQWFTSEAAIVGGGGIGVSYGLGRTTITALGVSAGFSNTAPLTITNPGAAVFTTIVPAGIGSLTYNASTLAAGSKICVIAKGIFASAPATTVTFRWRLDGITVYGPSNSVTPGAVTGVRFNFDTCLLILTDGVGGTALPVGEMEISTTQVASIPNTVVATTIDTTVAHTVAVEMAYSTFNAANTNRISSFYTTHVHT